MPRKPKFKYKVGDIVKWQFTTKNNNKTSVGYVHLLITNRNKHGYKGLILAIEYDIKMVILKVKIIKNRKFNLKRLNAVLNQNLKSELDTKQFNTLRMLYQ